MDGVKLAFGSRGMTGGGTTVNERYEGVESPGAYVDDRVLCCHFCLVPVFFRKTLPCSGGLVVSAG